MIPERFRFALLPAFLLAASVARPTFAQTADAALKDRVSQLVEKLAADKPEAAKSAEDALVKLGPRVLPLLPDEAKADAKRKKPLERVRAALKGAMDAINIGATKVTLKAKGMRLSEVVQKLQAMSGNPITDLREAEGGDAPNPSLDVDFENTPFLEALDSVARQAKVNASYYTGDGTIGLMAGGMTSDDDKSMATPQGPFVAYEGPFRVVFRQITSVRDIQSGTANANAQFEIGWEPRLRPMLLALKADEIKVVDDRGKEVEVQVKDESSNVVLRPENPVAEMNISLKSPDRAAREIKSFKVTAELSIPAGLKTFRFPSLDVKGGETKKQNDIAVTLESTEVDEQVWKVNVVLTYPGGGPAFESYQQGLFNNRIWLQKADGSRFEHNGGFSNTSAEGGKLGFEYLFVDAPGKPSDYQLVYETPSQVKTIPLSFEFKNVPLP